MRLLSSFFSGNRGVKFLNGGCVGEPDAIANVISYAKFRSRSHDVVVRVCDDAVPAGRKAVELLPVSSDTFNGPFHLVQLAEIHARLGNADEALSIVRQLREIPAGAVVSPALLRLDPVWDPLRTDPRFQELWEEKQQ